MNTVQFADFKNGKKVISLNGYCLLEKVALGDNVSQDDFENLQRGDSVFTHQSGGVTTIYSVTKAADLVKMGCHVPVLVEDIRHLAHQ